MPDTMLVGGSVPVYANSITYRVDSGNVIVLTFAIVRPLQNGEQIIQQVLAEVAVSVEGAVHMSRSILNLLEKEEVFRN